MPTWEMPDTADAACAADANGPNLALDRLLDRLRHKCLLGRMINHTTLVSLTALSMKFYYSLTAAFLETFKCQCPVSPTKPSFASSVRTSPAATTHRLVRFAANRPSHVCPTSQLCWRTYMRGIVRIGQPRADGQDSAILHVPDNRELYFRRTRFQL